MTADELYEKERDAFHAHLQKRTGSSPTRAARIYIGVLAYEKLNKNLFADIKLNDHGALRNRLRYFAWRLDIVSARFQVLSIQEQHRFCQRLKEQLAQNIDLAQHVTLALEQAQRELMQLVQTSPEPSDEQLIQWMQIYLDNELQIIHFTFQWEKLQQSLQWQARGKTRHAEEAEDLMQETFFHALKYIRKHHKMPEEGKIKAWLGKTMHHAFLDDVRDYKRLHTETLLDEQLEQQMDEEDIEQTVIEQQATQEIERILQLLLEEDRKVMELHLLKDIPLSEIAVLLKENPETVRARFKRARPKVLAKLPAESLHGYLIRFPKAEARAFKLLQSYIPNKAARSFDPNIITTEKEYDVLVRYILSLYVQGHNSREIAQLLTSELTEQEEAPEEFTSRMQAIQKCLDEHLPRLFSSFYTNKV